MSASIAPIWKPSRYDLNDSPLARFRDVASNKSGRRFTSYHDLHEWSVDPKTAGDFWMILFEFLQIGATIKPSKAFEPHHGKMFPSPRFFPDAKMNFAQSVLFNRDPTKIALIESSEGSLQANKITWAMLYSKVKIRADALISLGVSDGDRIAAVVANTEHSITLCLATLSIGAIWSSISPDFGTKGILDRLLQIQPKVVFADPSTRYNGKLFDLRPTIKAWGEVIVKNDPQVHIILTPIDQPEFDISAILQAMDHGTFLSKAKGRPLEFSQFSFDKPAFIFYSSGTTGSPKCILHSAGGVLMQVRKDYELQIGVLPTDILFQYTTTAWIMWAFILSALGTGCSIVLYTGSPVYPNVNFIPKLLSELKVTVFGTSAKYLTDLMDSGSRPRDEVDLSSLRKISSTGSVLPPDVAVWFYTQGFPRSIQLVSGSGGTDCACAFVCGSALLPLYPNEIQTKALGMAVDVFNSEGKAITNGEPGELVCKAPFPSQPISFWGKNGTETYRKSYFEIFGDNVWAQGDLIRIGKTGGVEMLGRSDGVLNPSGVRFGSAEIYNAIRRFSEVGGALCVGQRRPHDRDEAVILFIQLKPDFKKTLAFKSTLKREIGNKLTKRHIPKYIFYVDAIPYSIVGKKLETLVKSIVSGRKITSNVVLNPESLPLYEKYYDVEKAALEEEQITSKL